MQTSTSGSTDPIGSDDFDTLLYSKYLDYDAQVPRMSGTDHRSMYAEREEHIEHWGNSLVGSDIQVWQTHLDLHSFLRAGDWVVTNVADERRFGQAYKLPQSFPEGHYILRVLVPAGHRTVGWEPVFVARRWDEFETLGDEMNLHNNEDDKSTINNRALTVVSANGASL